MKKIISTLLISALLASSLTACNNDGGSSVSGAGSSSNTDPASNPGGENNNADNSGIAYPDNRAGALAKAALTTNTWPKMDLVSNANFIEVQFSSEFDLSKCEEYCFVTNMMSTQLNKVVIIKPAAGNEDAVQTAINNYLESVKNNPDIAFYPAQQESAAGAVSGTTGDGYLYLIVHPNGSDIADAIKSAQ